MKSTSSAVLQPQEFDELVNLYRPKVFRYAFSVLRDRDVAETVAQDCFVRAFQSLDSFRHECSMQAWLMRIALNLIRDYARSRRLQFWRSTADKGDRPLETYPDHLAAGRSPESKAMLRQQVAFVWKAAETLPDRQREVFSLRFVKDMNILEIVTVTGMKEGTVKTHLSRALHAIRAALQREDLAAEVRP
jgi:RNA polymerase sigma-70 factor (ECF subfamily)